MTLVDHATDYLHPLYKLWSSVSREDDVPRSRLNKTLSYSFVEQAEQAVVVPINI